jgi:hypothetical protein
MVPYNDRMPLLDLPLDNAAAPLPREVAAYLREAEHRIERFRRDQLIHGFVPGDHVQAYAALKALRDANLAPGELFCEWGSGFGVAAGLAALLGFEAYGIEVEESLVEAARALAADFDLPVTFAHGSFLPAGYDAPNAPDDLFWLAPYGADGHDELGLGPNDFDVIYAYPWPGEDEVIADLFTRRAATGAVLVTYHGAEALRLRRKVQPASRR